MRVGEPRPQAVPTPEIRAGAHSAKGLRKENQDAMTRFQSRFGEVILVADGMGGHQGGAVASDMVAKRFRYHLDAAAETTMPVSEALQWAAARVNDEIYERGHAGDPAVAGMGSTMVAAVLRRSASGPEVIVANAGDSRAYLLRGGVLRQLTRDHTVTQRMVEAGLLSPADAKTHPQSSVLSRALGQQPGTTVDTYPPVNMLPGDGLLLCSDGLSGYALDPEIASAIESASDPNTVVRNLVELALNKGSDDNITVQFLRLGPSAVAIAAPADRDAIPPRHRYQLAAIAAVFVILIAGSAGWMGWRSWQTHKTGPRPPQEHKNTLKNPARADSAGEGSGAAPPAAQPQALKTRNVVLYVSERGRDPDWLPALRKLATVQITDAETGGRFAPDKQDIVAWYRKDAEAEFERLASSIPALRAAKRNQDDSIPARIDILIVMPRSHK